MPDSALAERARAVGRHATGRVPGPCEESSTAVASHTRSRRTVGGKPNPEPKLCL
jgi:hypothetical protein